jgi:hypothetical protein
MAWHSKIWEEYGMHVMCSWCCFLVAAIAYGCLSIVPGHWECTASEVEEPHAWTALQFRLHNYHVNPKSQTWPVTRGQRAIIRRIVLIVISDQTEKDLLAHGTTSNLGTRKTSWRRMCIWLVSLQIRRRFFDIAAATIPSATPIERESTHRLSAYP